MSEEKAFALTRISIGDKKLTELFVAHAKHGNKYICWGCGKEFDNEDIFKKHFQEHINDFFKGGV